MRVGALGYATTQGLGHLMKDFFDGGVIDDPLVFRYPRTDRENHLEWYPEGTWMVHGKDLATQHHRTVREWMLRCDVILFFETPFDWRLLRYARSLGKKTAIVPMHEWWPEQPPALPDLFVCPSQLDLDVFTTSAPNRTQGFLNEANWGSGRATFLPVPAPSGTWRQRTRARRFLHNAGHVGSRNHKGTDTLLAALQHVTQPIDVTIRCQEADALNRLKRDYYSGSGNGSVTFTVGDLDRSQLFPDDFDVYVAPEKYNGLSLPLQEAFAAGMPVVTTDRYPANTWLPKEPLVPVSSTRRVRVAPANLEIEESVIDPKDLARVLDGMFDQDVTELSLRGKAWAEVNSWENLRPKYRAALEAIL